MEEKSYPTISHDEPKSHITLGWFTKTQNWLDITEEANKKGYTTVNQLKIALGNDYTVYRGSHGNLGVKAFTRLMERIKALKPKL